MDAEERRAIETTLQRFASRLDEVLFAIEGPDGDMALVPQLLAEARQMDIVADPAPDAPGYDFGVWGRHCLEEGATLSLLTLSLLGEACAGFAAAVHAQGLACLALGGQAHCPPATPLAAAFTPSYGIPLSARNQSEGTGLRLVSKGESLELNGTSHFIIASDTPRKLICFAHKRSDNSIQPEWVSLFVDATAPGLELTEVTGRTGLRAVHQAHLHCDQVVVPADQVLSSGQAAVRSLQRVMACDWLGQAAIGLGVARRALRDSRTYTAQRYQGGRIIEEHAGIQLLQGTAEYDIALLTAILYRHAGRPLSSIEPPVLLRWALGAKLAIVEHAHRAVTHCLQTLGGYGYTEDYGFEKRLRDVSTLKTLHGAPDQLKLFLNELARTEGGG